MLDGNEAWIIFYPFAVGMTMIVFSILMAIVGKALRNKRLLDLAGALSFYGMIVACPVSFWFAVMGLFLYVMYISFHCLFTLNEEDLK
ncbi:MAG: hypothetical protein GY820_17305 [Gammaproteobacteria bacterium]|nr:hypothetical protein [Gammaproteobacteria bacterium]